MATYVSAQKAWTPSVLRVPPVLGGVTEAPCPDNERPELWAIVAALAVSPSGAEVLAVARKIQDAVSVEFEVIG